MTIYTYFVQMGSGSSLFGAQPLPSPPWSPLPPHSPHDRTPDGSEDISNTDVDQYLYFVQFFYVFRTVHWQFILFLLLLTAFILLYF